MKYKLDNAKKFNYLQVINKALGLSDSTKTFDKSDNFILAQQMQQLGLQNNYIKAGFLTDNNGIGRNLSTEES